MKHRFMKCISYLCNLCWRWSVCWMVYTNSQTRSKKYRHLDLYCTWWTRILDCHHQHLRDMTSTLKSWHILLYMYYVYVWCTHVHTNGRHSDCDSDWGLCCGCFRGWLAVVSCVCHSFLRTTGRAFWKPSTSVYKTYRNVSGTRAAPPSHSLCSKLCRTYYYADPEMRVFRECIS